MIAVPLPAPEDSAPVALPRPVPGAGPVSIRLADIDARLDALYGLEAEHRDRLADIDAVLLRVECTVNEVNSTIAGLLASVRKHPLLSRFIGG